MTPRALSISSTLSLASLQARHCLGELHDFVGTEHQRQLAGLTSVGDAFWDNRFAKRDVVEKPQCTNDLVQGWP